MVGGRSGDRIYGIVADGDTGLLGRVLVPVAEPRDAATSGRALTPYAPGHVVVLTVIEKAGGAPDKASVEQRDDLATEAFEAFRGAFGGDAPVETERRYARDVSDAIVDAAADHDVTAIAFVPREGSRLGRFLSGDVALSLVTGADRPVISLPAPDDE